MSQLAQEIGKRLRAARKAAGYRSATALASARDIPMSTYSQHESGKRALSADMILYYSELFGVRSGWLLSGEGYPYAANTENAEHRTSILNEELFDITQPDKFKVIQQDLSPINSKVAKVDMSLFSAVFMRIMPMFQNNQLGLNKQELWDFAVEVYNGIISTSASEQDKLAMIDLSIASLKRGVKQEQDVEKIA